MRARHCSMRSRLLAPASRLFAAAAMLRMGRCFRLAVMRRAKERDDFSSNRHLTPSFLVEHDLFRKPVSTFRDHALEIAALPPPGRLLTLALHPQFSPEPACHRSSLFRCMMPRVHGVLM